MSHPKKLKNWRRVTYGEMRYRWCFRSDKHDSRVTLHWEISGGQQAIVMLRGIPDFWLAFPAMVPWVWVRPWIVRRMIKTALARGWQPARHLAPLRFDFEYEPGDIIFPPGHSEVLASGAPGETAGPEA